MPPAIARTAEKQAAAETVRTVIARLFAAGGDKAAFAHRLNVCLHASQCGRICSRLVKAPGVAGVHCVDVATGKITPLYETLDDPAFLCPEGLF